MRRKVCTWETVHNTKGVCVNYRGLKWLRGVSGQNELSPCGGNIYKQCTLQGAESSDTGSYDNILADLKMGCNILGIG